MSGRLGKIEAATGGAYSTVYSVPLSSSVATCNVLMCNTTAAVVTVNLAVSTSTSPANVDFINYQFEIPPNGILERTALVLSPGEIILASASTAGVMCRAHGYLKG